MLLSLPAGRWIRLLAVITLLAGTGCRATGSALSSAARPASAEARVSDAEAVALLLLAGNVVIASSRVAAARTHDAGVAAYAERVRTDHASMNAALAELIAASGMDATEGARGRRLREASADRRALLETLTGRAFDVGYLDAELQSQRETAVLLEMVQAGVTRPALREHAAALRAVVAAHAAHAEQLRGTLTARG